MPHFGFAWNKAFIHVFDEFSLEVVLKERDTAADFIDYLRARPSASSGETD